MDSSTVLSTFDEAVSRMKFADSPFLERWREGTLGRADILGFVEQFRHFETILPGFLDELAQNATAPVCRSAVQQNLDDELGRSSGRSHVDLLDDCIRSLGGRTDAEISAAMANLRDVCVKFIFVDETHIAGGIAVLLAYEMQSPFVAARVAEGLRQHYEAPDDALAFWDLHADLDHEHAEWLARAIAEITETPEQLTAAVEAVRAIADAWVGFLDERLQLALAA